MSDEFSDPVFFDISEIFDHAHVVFGAVSFIQISKSFTGEIVTSKTIFGFAASNDFAVHDPASDNGNGFVGLFYSASGAPVFFSQISHAYAAVHAAGRDKGNSCQGTHRISLLSLEFRIDRQKGGVKNRISGRPARRRDGWRGNGLTLRLNCHQMIAV